MERGSDKHNPRIDDEQKKESASLEQGGPAGARVEEHRMTEDPGGLQPEPTPSVTRGRAPGDTVLSLEEAESRSSIARSLDGAIFPAHRETLLANARENSAPDGVLAILDRLPEGS